MHCHALPCIAMHCHALPCIAMARSARCSAQAVRTTGGWRRRQTRRVGWSAHWLPATAARAPSQRRPLRAVEMERDVSTARGRRSAEKSARNGPRCRSRQSAQNGPTVHRTARGQPQARSVRADGARHLPSPPPRARARKGRAESHMMLGRRRTAADSPRNAPGEPRLNESEAGD